MADGKGWTVAQWKEYQRKFKAAYYFIVHGQAIQPQGLFCIIQLVPELDPQRIKFGFTFAITTRLAAHRTTCPNARLLKSWPCQKSRESAAIDRLSEGQDTIGKISGEVFRCTDLEDLLLRGDAFFATMPS